MPDPTDPIDNPYDWDLEPGAGYPYAKDHPPCPPETPTAPGETE